MKNIFLILKQIFILLSLVGPLVSQGAIHKNEKFSLNQAIVFEIFEAIKNGDSKNYEGLFYELAANLESPGEFRRLLSMTDERGNNIFHLMASVPPESPAFRFFLKEIGNLLVFLTLPKKYYDSLSLNPPSFGGMSYEEMPEVIKFNRSSMTIESVIKDFLQKENNKGETPLTIAQQDNKIPRDYNALEQFNNMYVNSIYQRDQRLRGPYHNDDEKRLGLVDAIMLVANGTATFAGGGFFIAMFIGALGQARAHPRGTSFGIEDAIEVAGAGAFLGFSISLVITLTALGARHLDHRWHKEFYKGKCYEAIARWKADIDHNI